MANGFTTFEVTKYIILSKKESESITSFFNSILQIRPPFSKITWNDAERFKRLGSSNRFLDPIRAFNLDENKIANNIKAHLRKDTHTVEADMKKDIKDTMFPPEDEPIKKDLLNCTDFSLLLAKSLLYTLEHQQEDRKLYKCNYENLFSTISLAKEKKAPAKKQKPLDSKYSSLQEDLTSISHDIYDEMVKNKIRYNMKGIEASLLSQGSNLDTSGSSAGTTMPLISFFTDTSSHLFISGDGGIGKTTFLLQILNMLREDENVIPLFLSLSGLKECSLSTEDSFIEHAILKRLRKLASDKLHSFDATKTSGLFKKALDEPGFPQIVLLLDGFNEISDKDNSALSASIKKDILSLSSKKNVRIILTSRVSVSINDTFTYVHANGIDDTALYNFLTKENIPFPSDNALIEILKSPLFLIMYAANYSRGIHEATTRGSILYAYCNGTNPFYYEALVHDPERNDNTAIPSYIPYVMDFMFPAIAATMKLSDSFSISIDVFDNLMDDAATYALPLDCYNVPHYQIQSAQHFAKRLSKDESNLDVVMNRLAFLHLDVDNKLAFSHQYYKDYFEALFFLHAISSISKKELPYYQYLCHPVDTDILNLVYEVAYASKLLDQNKLEGILSSLPKDSSPILVNNLLSLLSIFNGGSLGGIPFNNVDFSSITLSDFIFFDEDAGPASFTNCSFSENSFSSFKSGMVYVRCFAFYEDVPVICEVNLSDFHFRFNIIHYETKKVLKTHALNQYIFSFPTNLFCCNAMTISKDLNHIIIYNNAGRINTFYHYDLSISVISTYSLNKKPDSLRMFLQDDYIYALCDDDYLAIYDLTIINSIFHVETSNKISVSSATLSKDMGLIREIHIPSFYSSDAEKGNRLPLSDVMLSEDLFLVLVYGSKNLHESIAVFSINEEKLYDLSLPKVTENNPELSRRASYLYHDLLYLPFHDSIYEINIKYGLIKTYPLQDMSDNPNFVFRKGINIYTCSFDRLYEYSMLFGEIMNMYDFDLLPDVDKLLINDKYILCGNALSSCAYGSVFRFDKKNTMYFSYGQPDLIKASVKLNDNRLIVIYSNGYVAIINSDTNSLADCFFIPAGYKFSTLTYSNAIDHLALALNRLSDDGITFTDVFIFDVSNGKHEIIYSYSHSYPSKLIYATDGSLFFEEMMGTIEVRDTKGYANFYQLDMNDEVIALDVMNHYLLAFCFSVIESDTSSIDMYIYDTDNLTSDPMFCRVQGGASLVDSLLDDYDGIRKVAPDLYRLYGSSLPSSPYFHYFTIDDCDDKLKDITMKSDMILPNETYIPSLMIKGCAFHQTQKLSQRVCDLIKENLGILFDD